MSITKQILHPKGNTSVDIYPKTSVDQVEGLVELLTNYITQNDLMSTLADYITQNDLTTELANYITSSALSTILADYITQSGLATELLNYVTNSGLSSTLANYITSSALSTILADYITQSGLATELLNYVTNSDLSSTLANYITSSALTTELLNYVKISEFWAIMRNYVTSSDLATELNKYGKKITFTKYDVVLTETVNSIEYNLHNTNAKVLYLIIGSPAAEIIPSQNVLTDVTINNSYHMRSPSWALLNGVSGFYYYKFDARDPLIFQDMGSYRYRTYGQTLYQLTPQNVVVNSVNSFKIDFSGDGLPSNATISFYEGVYEQ